MIKYFNVSTGILTIGGAFLANRHKGARLFAKIRKYFAIEERGQLVRGILSRTIRDVLRKVGSETP